jgi:hypothetical protein
MQNDKILEISQLQGNNLLLAVRTKVFSPNTKEKTLLISVRDPDTDDYLATLVLEDKIRWAYSGKFSNDEQLQIINQLKDHKEFN